MKVARRYYYDVVFNYEVYCTIRATDIVSAQAKALTIAAQCGYDAATHVAVFYRM